MPHRELKMVFQYLDQEPILFQVDEYRRLLYLYQALNCLVPEHDQELHLDHYLVFVFHHHLKLSLIHI